MTLKAKEMLIKFQRYKSVRCGCIMNGYRMLSPEASVQISRKDHFEILRHFQKHERHK
jgi:hypothetical protein